MDKYYVRWAIVHFSAWIYPWAIPQTTALAAFYDSGWANSVFFLCSGLGVVAFMVLMIILAVRSASQDRPDSSSDE